MHTLALTILTLAPGTDSLTTDSVADAPRSILFLDQHEAAPADALHYDHRQGFFCDFEDRLSRGRRFRIDLGVDDGR